MVNDSQKAQWALRCAILANEIQSIIIMFHTYIQDILWKNFPDWCLPDKQHPILRFPPVEGSVCLYNCSCSSTSLPSTRGNLRIGCCLSGRHQSGNFFHRISCIYVWNIILVLNISFTKTTLVWHILLYSHSWSDLTIGLASKNYPKMTLWMSKSIHWIQRYSDICF